MSKFAQFDSSGKLVARYDSELNGTAIPADAIEISDSLFWQTINETDGIWMLDQGGGITKHALPPPSDAELASIARSQRDRLIVESEWRVNRHARELRLNIPTTDSIAALDIYMQALADVPQQAGFPTTIIWPAL